ncbi:MAG: VOC family protein [Dehalococcoidia bacterium]|nr:VOC family protein [Dehalococcoidia bacterium]
MEGTPYTLLRADGQDVAGVMTMTTEMGDVPPYWGIYIEVADTDACAARARQLGATVLQPPTDIVPGRFAMLQDPQGAVFGVIKSNPMG